MIPVVLLPDPGMPMSDRFVFISVEVLWLKRF